MILYSYGDSSYYRLVLPKTFRKGYTLAEIVNELDNDGHIKTFSRIRCACGIPTFNAIPPIIVFIINVIFYFITRNRVDTKKDLKFMIIVYILLLMIFCISLVAIPNQHHTIISLRI